MNIAIKRNTVPISTVATVAIDEQTVYTHQLMGEHKVSLITIVREKLDVRIGDYIEVGSQLLTLNQTPDVVKESTTRFVYSMTFEGEVYDLYAKLFMDEGSADFSFFGTPDDLMILLISNMDVLDSNWAKGTVDAADPQTITFSQDSCRTALTKIAEAFGMEFSIDSKTIDLKKIVGSATLHSFSYGKNNGLYQLSRLKVEDLNVVTRVYGFGSQRNLDVNYRSGARRLVFADLKLEANVATYGVREGVFTDNSIFPNRTATVTAVSNDHSDKKYSVTDSTLDFDINDHLLEGVEAKIVFKSGDLSGFEFPILKYDHSTKVITYGTFTEQNDYTTPNATFEAAIGDSYTLVGISMPQSYIDTAETALEAATQAFLAQNSVPRVTYRVDIDPLYVLDQNIEIAPGDKVTVVDTDLGINDLIRVNAIEYPLVLPQQLTATIADTITYTEAERTIARSLANQEVIRVVDRTNVELARQNVARMRTLQGLIFDPDGFFDPVNIKPQSIETLMLAVGAKSQNFVLRDVEIEANNQGDANKLRMSAGELDHLEIEIEGLGSTWQMNAQNFNTLVTGNAYYIYARCSKSALTGDWKVSTSQITAESETGFYHFLLGVLYAAEDGRRFYEITKGMTFINGETITTGKIQSQDGLSYLDLTNNTFKVGNASSSIDWGVTEADTLTIKGALMTDFLMSEFALIENLGVRTVKTSDSGKRVEISGDGNNIKFYDANDNLVLTIDDSIYTTASVDYAGLLMGDTDVGGTKELIMSREGIRSRGRGVSESDPAVRGVLFGQLVERTGSVSKQSAGVVGRDTTSSGTGDSYGGYFDSVRTGGMYISGIVVTASHTVNRFQTIISCNNSSAITITLPSNPIPWRTIIIKRKAAGAVTIDGNGLDIFTDVNNGTTLAINDNGVTALVYYDGTEWQYQRMT